MTSMTDRRELLKFLAGQPGLARHCRRWPRRCSRPASQPAAEAALAKAADALDVFDFEAMARKVLPPAHWGYMATGSDGEETLRANSAGFSRYQLRVRRFVDVSRIDTSMTLFGQTFASPIALCPVGSQRAFHRRGRAGRRRGPRRPATTCRSCRRSRRSRVEDVAKARGAVALVSALHDQQLRGDDASIVQARRGGRLPGGGGDRRSAQRPQHPHRSPAGAASIHAPCASCHGASGRGADGRTIGPKPMFEGARHDRRHAHVGRR